MNVVNKDFNEEEILSNLTPLQKRIKLCLAGYAAKGKTITYGELCSQLRLPYSMDNPYHRNLISEDLGDISEEEVGVFDWPMLSCVVVEKASQIPAMGFFSWAEKLYSIKLRNWEERFIFFAQELKRAQEMWSSAEGQEEIRKLEKDLKY